MCEILKKDGINATLIGMPTVFPYDKEMIRKAAGNTGRVVTVEEHFVTGGLGSMITDELSDMKDVTVKRLGIPNVFATTSGNYRELVAYYGLDDKGIAQSVKEFI